MTYKKQIGDGFLAALILVAVISYLGVRIYSAAQMDISSSCEKQGSFYVGDRVFTCQEKKQ